MRVALINVEGVLADERSAVLPECQSLPEGLLLYASLKNHYSLVPYTRFKQDTAAYWLDREGFVERIRIISDADKIPDVVDELRRKGGDVQLLISANPDHVRQAFLSGTNALLAVHSAYARGEWLPEYVPTPPEWGELVATIETKRLELAEDQRLTEKDILG